MGENEETEVEPTPETEEEPEENFTRSGGRRASNLNRERNREVASKEIPAGNKLAESKLTETEKDVFDIIDEWHKSYPDHKMEYVEWLKINYPKEFEALKNSIKSYDNKVEEGKLIEAPTEEDSEFKKLCAEIEFQADENDFTLTDEDVKGIAKKMIADKFFFSHDIFADEDDEEAWGEINDLIVSAIEAYPNKVNESKEIKTEKKIVIDNMGETYTIDTDAKTYTVKTANGEKTFTFDEMNDFVRQARGANRIYKPYSLLAYTDFKNGNLRNWEVRQDLNDEGVYSTLEKKLNKIVQDELGGDPKYTVGKFDTLNSDGTVGSAIGIITEYNGTKYGIQLNANDWALTHLETGARIKTFDTYQKAIDSIPQMDKSIKAVPERIAELTKQFNDAKGKKTEAVNTTKVNNGANVVCTLNLKGEPKEVSGGFDSVDINIKGVNELTDTIKTAITQRFAGIFKSDWNGDIYTQDIRVAEDLWLTFLDYDENSNTLNFVLDGDITEDPALNESKKEESVSEKEYDDIVSAIDNATSIEELQDIVLAVSDGTVEDEMQSMLDVCIKDNDDLDTVKSLLSNIFEDNADIEE